MYTGWLPYFYHLAKAIHFYNDDIWILFFLLSSSAAVIKFINWQKSEKFLLLSSMWGLYFLTLLGNMAFSD